MYLTKCFKSSVYSHVEGRRRQEALTLQIVLKLKQNFGSTRKEKNSVNSQTIKKEFRNSLSVFQK